MSGARTNWVAVWAVFAGGLVAGAYVGKVPPALPALRDELGLTLVESGFIATMLNLTGALVGMLAGILCDRLGHKHLALAGLALMAGGGALGAAAWGFAPLLVARFVEGMGFILYTVSGGALMAAAAEERRDRATALSLWSAYMPSGAALALLVAPLVIGVSGWRGLWLGLAAMGLLCVVLIAKGVPATRRGQTNSLSLAIESLSQPGNIALSLLFMFYVAQWTSVMIWLPTFVVDARGGSTATAAILTALMVLANVPGNLGGGWLLARGVQRGRLVLSAGLVMALCSTGMLLDGLPDALRFALVLVFSCYAGVIPASIFSGLPLHAKTPQHLGTGNGMVMQSSQAGQFVTPIFLAWLATRFGGWDATLWAMLALAGGVAACGLAVGRIEWRLARQP